MKQDKLSWARLVSQSEAKQLPLLDYLLERSAAQLETEKASILAKMDAMLQVMEEAVAFGMTGVTSNSGLTGGSAKKLKEYMETIQAGGNSRPALLGPVAGSAECSHGAHRGGAYGRSQRHTAGCADVPERTLRRTPDKTGRRAGYCRCDRRSDRQPGFHCRRNRRLPGVYIFGGNGKQIGDAVSIVFKNMLGLVCDPVAGLVEVPCIKRNAGSVVQCLLAAELALAGVGSFIPADEAIDAMDKVGRALPYGLRETAEGGLAVTPTAKAWTEEYFKKIHS